MRPDSQIYMLLKNLARKLLMLPQERTQFGAAVFEHGILQMFVVLALRACIHAEFHTASVSRPYHVDPEVNHGIDKLIIRQGAAVVTEDSVSCYEEKFDTAVLNQWTYHSRLYAAAKYCTTQPDMDLVQLVSFGCGLDAITTDETREILQEGGKLYTQLKIDEITNLGAVNIRLRSLFAALEERKEDQ